MLAGLSTPGAKSSEFLVAVLNVVAQICLAWAGTIADGTAVKFSFGGLVAYILSRGLAKYEHRGGGGGT